jgi:hypothetical protein
LIRFVNSSPFVWTFGRSFALFAMIFAAPMLEKSRQVYVSSVSPTPGIFGTSDRPLRSGNASVYSVCSIVSSSRSKKIDSAASSRRFCLLLPMVMSPTSPP